MSYQIAKILMNKKVIKYLSYYAVGYYFPTIGICIRIVNIIF
jgi:hypothetical protein